MALCRPPPNPRPLLPALDELPACIDDVADICDWLLGSDDEEAAELSDDLNRMQRRKTETCCPPSAFAASSRHASFDCAPRRASCDLQRPHRASFDASRPPMATVPEGDRSGVLSWLAGWGKLAEEQGCSASGATLSPISSNTQQQSLSALPPRPSRPASMAAGSTLFRSGSGSPPASPFYGMAPRALAPQQQTADCSSDYSSDYSTHMNNDASAQRRSLDEQNSRQPSWLVNANTTHHVRSATPVPAQARASMDGWSDAGCAAVLAQHKRKREVAAAAALAAQLSATQLVSTAPQDSLGFGAQHTMAMQYLQQQPQQPPPQQRQPAQHYTVRGSLDGVRPPAASFTAATVFTAAGYSSRGCASLDLPRQPAAVAPLGCVSLGVQQLPTAATRLACSSALQAAPAEACFSMQAWDAALPVEELLGGISPISPTAAFLASAVDAELAAPWEAPHAAVGAAAAGADLVPDFWIPPF